MLRKAIWCALAGSLLAVALSAQTVSYVIVAWDASAGAEGYRAYRDGLFVAETADLQIMFPVSASQHRVGITAHKCFTAPAGAMCESEPSEIDYFAAPVEPDPEPEPEPSPSPDPDPEPTPDPEPEPDPDPTPEPPPAEPEVIVDTTPPSVTLLVSQRGNSHNYDATVTATDNVGVVRIDIRLDGVLQATCAETDCAAPLTMRNSGSYQVSATAWDAAGNSATATAQVAR